VDVVRRLLPELQRHPLYVTIDVDVLDRPRRRETGSPEPGGLRVPERLEIVRMLEGCQSSAETSWRSLTPGIHRPYRHRGLLGDPGGAAGVVGRSPLRLREKSRIREYSAPRLYEIAFDLNRKGEVDFLVHCFRRFSRRPVRRVVDIAAAPGPHLMRLADRARTMSGLDLSPRTSVPGERGASVGPGAAGDVDDPADGTCENRLKQWTRKSTSPCG